MNNFFNIYKYNKIYEKEEKRNQKALRFQVLIFLVVIAALIININLFNPSNRYWYLDQFDRIYALLIAVILTVVVILNTLNKHEKVKTYTSREKNITYKDDYMSVIMYTVFLYFIGITLNVFYATLFEYMNNKILDYIFWSLELFILLDSIFFTVYVINELADLIRKI